MANESKWNAGDIIGERWTLVDRITRYKEFVWWVKDKNGDTAVAKLAPYGIGPQRRFADEVQVLRKLGRRPGILPLIARDSGHRPKWFVMPKATPLAEHLRTVSVNELVQAFAHLAETLGQLHENAPRVFHRDIKPDNLFWHDGSAVFGDFGIAEWEGQTFETQELAKIGPFAFLAPEALNVTDNMAWYAADVYSLTKTMWSLAEYQAACTKGPVEKILYPPQGEMNATGDWAYSLAPYFGPAGRELDRLIQDATSNAPNRRPTARKFGKELVAWLRMNPGQIQPRADYHRGKEITNKWENLFNKVELYKQTKGAFIETLRWEIRTYFPSIRFDDTVRLESPPDWEPKFNEILDPRRQAVEVDWDYNEGPEPDPWGAAVVLRLLPVRENVRIIIGAVFDGDQPSMDLIAEIQTFGDNKSWSLTNSYEICNLSPGWPAATAALRGILKNLTSSPDVSTSQGWTATRII
ncbi:MULTISPECIES: protein kinase [Rhodococcus]|uniref:protein kinase domain-containing protein n=1 Tax=Rhodococcus TaxID=1827 RepID=UPI0015E10406|nr:MULTISPECIES: protein kinase [Rhodococcus]WKX01764.1 protein kinase [Rhodococcus aetherivorans]